MTDSILSKILDKAIKLWASDIHLSEGAKIIFRVNGELWNNGIEGTLSKSNMTNLLLELLNFEEDVFALFMKRKDMDFSYLHEETQWFRINAFLKLWKISVVMRQIASIAKTIEELWLPDGVRKFTEAKQGLILITGPTWSWKSTSMVSIIEEINKTRSEHVLTIEDPIEFIFENKKSIFSQREVWKDTLSFTSAMRSAFREDPDIIMVWELRDKETISLAIELAETGHLVIWTLHTAGSVSTISRMVSFFPSEIQSNIYSRLWECLSWVLSQRLIPLRDGSGRVGIYELMLWTLWIRNIISSGSLTQLEGTIETWRQEWMVTMENYANELLELWKINKESFIHYFNQK